jgi:hypothetical protein
VVGGEVAEREEPARTRVAVETAGVESAATGSFEIESPAESTTVTASPIDVGEKAAPPSRSRRSRQRGGPVVGAASTEAESGSSDLVAAATERAPKPVAVDSALSERVETLEHGLRRVLAEVKDLRELLADPSADR